MLSALSVPVTASATPSYEMALQTDKALYAPGETVEFEAEIDGQENLTLEIDYWNLNKLVDSEDVELSDSTYASWQWIAPDQDFTGYLVVATLKSGETTLNTANIAVDVSSTWAKFPRYGFLSKFGELSEEELTAVMENLNRFHINGIQFYDWQDRHENPLPHDGENIAPEWSDIANRPIKLETVESYISVAHQYGMKAMNYNLIFGAYSDYEQNGISPTWGLYKDSSHTEQDKHPLPDSWESDIYLFDPSNVSWQDYIIAKMGAVNQELGFDGWHVDQLGSRNVFTFNGIRADLAKGYAQLLVAAKSSLDTELVMNAVDQFGQSEILKSETTEFAYAELWDRNQWFKSIPKLVEQNWKANSTHPNTVIAAYVNKGNSSNPGTLNTPGVLTADAAIFAAGGSHIEVGEHLLANEYFPNSNLAMTDSLKEKLICYYDFSVAYQNLLRGDVKPAELKIKIKNHKVSNGSSVAAKSIWSFARKSTDGKKQILHLINLEKATTVAWRDNNGDLKAPKALKNLNLTFKSKKKIKSIWISSPDFGNNKTQSLKFKQKNGVVSLNVPKLQYWDMLVIN